MVSLKNKKIIVLIVLLLAVTLVSGYWYSQSKNKKSVSTEQSQEEKPKTTSTQESAQSEYSPKEQDDNKAVPGNTLNENRGSATVTDNSGTSVTPNAKPLVSSTGEITVYSPVSGGVVKSGQTISGESKLSKVNFRIIDSISGVIASGELSVVNGKFSGTPIYTTNAKEGRIDIFATKTDGTEYSNVEIPVRFQ